MKIYQVVNVLGAINETGKLASDMYELGKKRYYSESHGQEIPISEMDFQYMVRAFVKLCDQENMLDRSKHMGTTKDLVAKIERLEELLKEKDEHIDSLAKEEHRWRKAYHDNFNLEGHRYTFSDIPNDASGRAFVAQLREYLNTDSYKIRVRGQYLVDGENWRRYSFGQPIEKSKCLRVYVDKK